MSLSRGGLWLSGEAGTEDGGSTFLIVSLISDGCQAERVPTFSAQEGGKQYVTEANDSGPRATFNYYIFVLLYLRH